MDTVETITIKGANGEPTRINATDFKVGEHELHTGDDDKGKSDDVKAKEAEAAKNAAAGNNSPAPGQPIQQPAGQPRGAAKPA